MYQIQTLNKISKKSPLQYMQMVILIFKMIIFHIIFLRIFLFHFH